MAKRRQTFERAARKRKAAQRARADAKKLEQQRVSETSPSGNPDAREQSDAPQPAAKKTAKRKKAEDGQS